MRKLLLASAAMLGATSGLALAQDSGATFAPSQGMMPMPASPTPPASSFTASNAYGNVVGHVGGAAYGMFKPPTPGTITIHLGGKVEVDMLAQWSSNSQFINAAGVSSKTNPVLFSSYMRLYPGVDGMATNGLRYGASIELRENFPGSAAQPTPLQTVGNTAAAGAPVAPGFVAAGSAPSGSTYSSGQTVYVRRAFTYLANDNVGIVRFGNTDGVIGLFDPCIFYSGCWDAGAGNFNGGQNQASGVTGASGVPFAWLAQAGAEYGNTKIVYLSPQFFGFDFGVQYAPSMGNNFSTCNTAGATCNSVTTGPDTSRWYNQVGVGARYQGVFGPVAVGAYVFYETAGKVSAPAVSFAFNKAGGNQYDNLSFISAAAYVTVDTGFGKITPAIDYIGGALNGQLQMRPTGGVSENAVVAGLTYNNGPLTAAVQVGLVESQGAQQLTKVSQRHEFEIAVGGNYNLAPGLYLVAEYQYEQRHQGGFDFLTGALGAGASGATGTPAWKAGKTQDVHGQAIMFSTVVNW
jgi:hypothetical protein